MAADDWSWLVGLGGTLDDAAGPSLMSLGGASAQARGRLISQDVTDDPALRAQLFEQETEQALRGERAGLQQQLLERLRELREQEGEQLRATEGGFLAFERPEGEGLDLDAAVDFRPLGGGAVRGRLGTEGLAGIESGEIGVGEPVFDRRLVQEQGFEVGKDGQLVPAKLIQRGTTLRGRKFTQKDLPTRPTPPAEIAAKLKEKIAEARERRESLREERRALEAELLGGRPTSVGAVQGALRERREKQDAEQMSNAIDELRKIKKDAAALARDNPQAAKAFEQQQLGLLEKTLSKRVRDKLGIALTKPKGEQKDGASKTSEGGLEGLAKIPIRVFQASLEEPLVQEQIETGAEFVSPTLRGLREIRDFVKRLSPLLDPKTQNLLVDALAKSLAGK